MSSALKDSRKEALKRKKEIMGGLLHLSTEQLWNVHLNLTDLIHVMQQRIKEREILHDQMYRERERMGLPANAEAGPSGSAGTTPSTSRAQKAGTGTTIQVKVESEGDQVSTRVTEEGKAKNGERRVKVKEEPEEKATPLRRSERIRMLRKQREQRELEEMEKKAINVTLMKKDPAECVPRKGRGKGKGKGRGKGKKKY